MNREGNTESRAVPSQESEEFDPDLGEMLRALASTAKRRKWFILLPFALLTVGVGVVVLQLPSVYTSEATVGVSQQKVSQRFVDGDTGSVADAVTSLRQEILSRSSLLKIIEELDLYGDRSAVAPDDLVERMQTDMKVDALESRRDEVTALRVSFTAENPKTAQRVVTRLSNAFIEENAKQTQGRVRSNDSFLDEQVRAAEAKLASQEARLQAYKTRNLDQLPEQQSSNSIALADLRSRARAIGPDIDRMKRSLRSLEGLVSDKLSKLQADRAALMTRYTAQNPIVVKQDAEIAKYAALRELFSPDGPSVKARQVLAGADDAQITQFRNQADEYTNDIEKAEREQADLESQIRDYQTRVTAMPLREQEQSAILRDYNLFKADYEALKAKQLQAGLTTDLVEEEGGQRFRLVEPASLPFRPSGPNRLRFTLAGAAGGLVLGILLAFLRGSVDITFASEKEVASAYSVPLVLGIPEILTPKEQSMRTWKMVFEWVAGIALVACVISTEVYVYIHG